MIKSRIQAVVVIFGFVSAIGCGSPIKRPEIDIVKKVGFVTWVAHPEIRDSNGKVQEFAALVNFVEGKTPLSNVKAFAPVAMNALENAFKKIPGWTVVPATEIVKSKAYQNYVSGPYNVSFVVASPLKFVNQWGGQDHQDALAKLARDLNLDGIVIVDDVRFSYELNQSFLSTTATLLLSGNLELITREGKRGISSYYINERSKVPVPVPTLGDFLKEQSTFDGYQDLIRATADSIQAGIIDGLNKK